MAEAAAETRRIREVLQPRSRVDVGATSAPRSTANVDAASALRSPVDPEREIAALAGRQWGVVARRQLDAAGVPDGAIGHRVRAGRLHRVHRGVYVVGHTRLGLEGRLVAAALACGPGAVVPHRSAAQLRGIRDGFRERIEVTTALRGRGSRPGIDLHETRRLAGGRSRNAPACP